MHRISTDADYLKTGKVVIDADGVPVDVPDRTHMEAADTALGQRINEKAERSAMEAADTALGQRIDTEKWMRGNVPASATSLNDLAPGIWGVAGSTVATTLGLPEVTTGWLDIRRPLGHTVAEFTAMSTASRIGRTYKAHATSAGSWGPWQENTVKKSLSEPEEFLTSTTPVESLETGLYKVISSTVATNLSLPVRTSGSLFVHNFGTQTAVIEWRPTTMPDVWTRRKHGTSWGPWTIGSYVDNTPLSGSTPVEELTTGLYSVGNGTVAQTLGMPTLGSGSLWVHAPRGDLGRMEWRPTVTLDVWHRRRHGPTWAEWEKFTGSGGVEVTWSTLPEKPSTFPPSEHDHDDRYYTRDEVDTLVAGDPVDPVEFTGVNITLEDTGYTMYPDSIGIDGVLYGHASGMRYPQRTFDGLESVESGPRFTDEMTEGGIVYVTRTSAGYVVITKDDERASKIWFSETWDGPYTMVQQMGPFRTTGLAKPRHIYGTTWMLIGEYQNHLSPTWPLKRWLSTDGGQTWTNIRETLAIDTTTNSHHHTGLITGTGRIYSSEGDGRDNRWFGYTDDLGKTWIDVKVDETLPGNHPWYSQPTTMIDFGDYIFTSPDAGPIPPGMWRMDPHTHRQEVVWVLEHGGPYTDASKQWCQAVYAQAGAMGREVYAMFPDGGSGNRTTYIAATPDGGNRWGVVATVDTSTGGMNGGVWGPDRDGWCYVRGYSIPTYGSNALRFKTLDWRQIEY